MTTTDAWQPDQYARFAAERRMAFDALVELCVPISKADGLVYDIGCGPGSLTAELPDRLGATTVVGTDNSPAMLAKAEPLTTDHLRFVEADLRRVEPARPIDIIFSNAALQWVEEHDEVLAQWRTQLADDGQLAVQVPTNADHPAYLLAARLGQELADWFPDGPPALAPDTVQPPEFYARTLHQLGATDLHVSLRVFTHLLTSTSEVTEWIKGTSLNRFRTALGDERFADFEAEFTRRLLIEEGDQSPYLFTFKRILMWARF